MNYDGEIVIGTGIDTSGIENDLNKLKKELGDGKASKRIGENDIGEKIVEGIAFGIKKNAYQATKAMDEALKALKLQRNTGIIDEEEYYNQLEKMRDQYFEKGSVGWWNYTAEIIGYETKLYNEQLKNFEKTVSEIEKRVEEFNKSAEKSFADYERKMENLEKKEEKFTQKLTGNSLLNKITFKTGEEDRLVLSNGTWKRESADIVSYKLADLKDDINLLAKYDSLLGDILKKEKLPTDIINSLKSTDAEGGINLMSAILGLSDEEYEKYVADYAKRSEISEKIAKTLYNSEAQEIKQEFLEELEEAFGNVNENFLKCGQEAANSFGKSFGGKIEEILNSIKATIESELESIQCTFSVDVSRGGGDTRIYNLYGSGETTAQKLQAARQDAELERMRGGY